MKEQNVIVDKSFAFALKIVKLHLHLKSKNVDRVISYQLLKSGTSIGANVEEAIGGSSRKDFVQKLRIAYREARESSYWLRLLKESELLEKDMADPLLSDCNELIRILTAIINSTGKS